ncbi:MAG: Lrp/AsnC family transcriptional regulator [Deltaproteobacteria bacterium]|jgi:DNA-binding Lrp family transcriptional regulator|nr:Lrp/AsnC family transcriptional regulator [Deltaproteobacteria bacterium]
MADSQTLMNNGPDSLTPSDKKLINLLSGDLGLSPNPYAELADKLALSESEVIQKIKNMTETGLIRRFGSVVVHQKSGFTANAMIVWLLDEDNVDQTGEKFACLPFVSHCYRRCPAPGWPYNLYTMIHAENRDKLDNMVRQMAELSRSKDWKVLESLREFKKESLRLFT